MKDKITVNIKKFDKSFTINLKLFYYIPFIGWIYPMTFKSDEKSDMNHAKQGFVMAVFFAAVLIALSVSTIMIAKSSRVLRLAIVLLIYAFELTYFSLCIWGTMQVYKEKEADFPIIKTYADKIDI